MNIPRDYYAIFKIKQFSMSDESLIDFLKEYLHTYLEYLKQNKTDYNIISAIENYSKYIIMCILEYSCGQRHNARILFEEAIILPSILTPNDRSGTEYFKAERQKRGELDRKTSG